MAEEKIGRAILEITVDDKQYKFAMDQIAKTADKTAKDVRNVSQLLSAEAFVNFAKTALSALTSVGEGIIKLGEHGADVADVTSAFDDLSARVGATGEEMRTSLSEGVLGTVSNFELMQLANKALGAGLVKSADDMKVLSEGAFLLANRTGGNAKDAFETLTSTIASGKTAQLKQLGLFVDNKVAVENYAKSIGKSAGDLTAQEKATALSQATLAKLRAETEAAGPATADFADMVQQARVAFANFTDQLGLGIAASPVLQAGLQAVGAELTSAFGVDKQGLVGFLVGLIERFAIGLGKVAQFGISVGQVLSTAFFSARIALNAVLEAVFSGVGKVTGMFASLFEQMAKVPVIGAQWKPVAESLRAQADAANSLAFGFGDLKDKAAAAAIETSDRMEGVKTAIGKVVSSMEAARSKTAEATETTRQYNTTVAPPEVAERSIEADNKIAESRRKLAAELSSIGLMGLEEKKQRIQTEFEAEVARIQQIKDIAPQEVEAQRLLAEQIRLKKLEQATLEGDELLLKKQTLEQELLQLTTTSEQAKLAQIAFARQQEIAGLEPLKMAYGSTYAELVGLVNAKYAEMTAQAQGHFANVVQMANEAGFQSRAQLEANAAKAAETYNRMKESGKFTYDELQAARVAMEEANTKTAEFAAQAQTKIAQDWGNAAVQVMGALGIKNKALAIAMALINTYQGVAKTWAVLGFPAAIPGAAIALASGLKAVQQIRSQGFATGTPGLDFANFGKVTTTDLHGNEAVIPQGSGHALASEIAAAMPAAGGGGDLDRLADRIISAPINPVSVSVTLDGRQVGEAVLRLSRTGALRVHTSAVVTS